MEHVAESEVLPNWHVFVSIFGQAIEEKLEKYSQSGYCSSTITYSDNGQTPSETQSARDHKKYEARQAQ